MYLFVCMYVCMCVFTHMNKLSRHTYTDTCLQGVYSILQGLNNWIQVLEYGFRV